MMMPNQVSCIRNTRMLASLAASEEQLLALQSMAEACALGDLVKLENDVSIAAKQSYEVIRKALAHVEALKFKDATQTCPKREAYMQSRFQI